MNVSGKTAIVTGGGRGIGAAIATALVREGARVLIADLDEQPARDLAAELGQQWPGRSVAVGGDVSDPAAITAMIERASGEFGSVDMYFANAGIFGEPGLGEGDGGWDRAFEVNVRAHVRAAQQLVPGWLERGEGYFVSTASAAGLLTQLGMAAYSTTKHAAVGFAEWLSIAYGDKGIRVSCLCPMGVATDLLSTGADAADPDVAFAARSVGTAGQILAPDTVADAVLAAIAEERFLILPHPEVLEMYRHKGSDYDRWLAGMRRFQAALTESE
ncbi:MAG: SDR family NAD(P)-dependent oxidoreductase [Nocardia sp.]|nr:SDR family NAD(P)-dependent oxidoreductase [Nocardia sp.]